MLKKEPKLEKFNKPAHLFMSTEVTDKCAENERYAAFVDRSILAYVKRASEVGLVGPDYAVTYKQPRGKYPAWIVVITTKKPKNKRLSTMEIDAK